MREAFTMGGHLIAAIGIDGKLADLDMPASAYRVLLQLRSKSEPGGRVRTDQEAIAQQLRLSRPCVNRAFKMLESARLIAKMKNGIYQVNPVLAGYGNMDDLHAAIDGAQEWQGANSLRSLNK
ncbi:helix-turn-helix domain-containing protein [Streptomyces sp900105245]|uniref:Helix-turn-helix domain-containing protein n=1 Tax=Streptomyces sp. 900105245 TaxID=3154379 RepID=A0ABV1UK53_9ACTN